MGTGVESGMAMLNDLAHSQYSAAKEGDAGSPKATSINNTSWLNLTNVCLIIFSLFSLTVSACQAAR